ncbi:Glycogen(starch) synthase [Micromonospora noduli]|nr:Glycogen(starch) synthase [Micromonospora noduli]
MSLDAHVIDINPARQLRVLMLSWEYPPVLVGGLGRHVHALSVALAAAGHEVTVVTRHSDGAPLEEYADGVRILRAPEDPVTFPLATGSLLAWTMAFNHTLTRTALRAPRPAPTTSSTPTTGSSPTRLSPSPSTWTSPWSPPCTPPRPAGTRAGCRRR